MVTLHEVITFLVSMQISISSLQTHNVNRCGRSRHLARKLSLRRKRSSPDRKSGSAGMPRPSSYAVFCLKKKDIGQVGEEPGRHHQLVVISLVEVLRGDEFWPELLGHHDLGAVDLSLE